MKRGILHGCCLITAFLLPLTLLCSCGNKDGYNSKSHIKNAVEHMNEKYGAEFEFKGSNTKVGSGDVFGRHSEYVNILVSCDELPGKDIEVFSNDGETYFDNYIVLKYEEQAIQLITDAANEIYGGDKIVTEYYFSGDTTADMTTETTLEEALLSGVYDGIGFYTDDTDDMLGDYRRFIELLKERGINISPSVYYFDDDIYLTSSKKMYDLVSFDCICEMNLEQLCCVLDETFDGTLLVYRNATVSGIACGISENYPLVPPENGDDEAFEAFMNIKGEKDDEDPFTFTVEDHSFPEIDMPEFDFGSEDEQTDTSE